jgi:starvation-inducible DNA-binding protein
MRTFRVRLAHAPSQLPARRLFPRFCSPREKAVLVSAPALSPQGIWNSGHRHHAVSQPSTPGCFTGHTSIPEKEERNFMPASPEMIERQKAALATRADIEPEAVKEISGALNALLADVFSLYLKTKNFHWHMSGPHFRDYHLLLDEHGDQLFAMTDDIAERVRKIGGTTIRSVGHIARLQRIPDNDAEYVTPEDMLSELREDEKSLILSMRAVHTLCDDAGDVATASLLENWIDQAQRRNWFLFEATRR